MRSPFIKRESEAEKQAKIAAKEARLTAKAKAWKQFWFKVKLVIAGLFVGFASLIGFLIYVASKMPPQNYAASPAIGSSSSQPANKVAGTPKTTSKDGTSYKEGVVEKVYEKMTGKEIVHKKDGSTYTRDQPKKK